MDVRDVAVAAEEYRAVLDEVTEPKLLSGDLRTVHQASQLSEPGLW